MWYNGICSCGFLHKRERIYIIRRILTYGAYSSHCGKPSVGRDIARVLGCQSSGRGCLTGGDWVVTWAVGHLVTLVEPDELDEKYKRWSFDTLPILPAESP